MASVTRPAAGIPAGIALSLHRASHDHGAERSDAHQLPLASDDSLGNDSVRFWNLPRDLFEVVTRHLRRAETCRLAVVSRPMNAAVRQALRGSSDLHLRRLALVRLAQPPQPENRWRSILHVLTADNAVQGLPRQVEVAIARARVQPIERYTLPTILLDVERLCVGGRTDLAADLLRRFSDAVPEARVGCELELASVLLQTAVSNDAQETHSNLDRVIACARAADEEPLAQVLMAQALLLKGELDIAAGVLNAIGTEYDKLTEALLANARGDDAAAEQFVLQMDSSVEVAIVRAAQNDVERTFAALEHAVRKSLSLGPFYRSPFVADAIRNDPRYPQYLPLANI